MKTSDDGCGLIKLQWGEVREKVSRVNSKFAKLLDQVSPDCPFYISYIPYGEVHCDNHTLYYFDTELKKMIDIRSDIAPKCLKEDLGYGMGSMPLSMVLEKQIEVFGDYPDEKVTGTKAIIREGKFFPLSRMLEKPVKKPYFPSDVLYGVSGLRQVMMIPSIHDHLRNLSLKQALKLRVKPPQYLYDHWFVFKEIAKRKQSTWQSCILYFPKKFMEIMMSDPAWIDVKIYLQELAWGYHQYQLNESTFECAFAILEDSLRLRPNPHILDTAKQVYKMSIGVTAGYEPAVDESGMPIKCIQEAYLEHYDLYEYIPTIMTPILYDYRTDKHPVYYSMYYPESFLFSPKVNQAVNRVIELRELQNTINEYQETFSNPKKMCGDTLMGEGARILDFDVFHSRPDEHNIVRMSHEVADTDLRFHAQKNQPCAYKARFEWAGMFMRGCIRVSRGK